MKKEKKRQRIEKLYGNRDAILDNLKNEKEVTNEHVARESEEGKCINWREFCIKFPWKEYEFKYFFPFGKSQNKILEYYPGFKKMIFSNKEVAELFEQIRIYMEERGVKIDSHITNYEEEIKVWKGGELARFEALKYFIDIVGFDDEPFFLKDENSDSHMYIACRKAYPGPEYYHIYSKGGLPVILLMK